MTLQDRTMPFEQYRNAPGVNQSMLKLIGRSPAHLRYALDNPPEKTRALILGTIYHSMIFDGLVPEDLYHVRPETYQDAKTSEWKKWTGNATACKDWLAAHDDKPVLSQSEHESVIGVCLSVCHDPFVKMALSQGRSEQSLFCKDEETGLMLKCRPDWLSGEVILDLKTCEDASEDAFARSIATYGYDVQAAFYLDVCAALKLGKKHFVFVCAEKEPPWAVACYQLDEESIDIGRRKYRYWLPIYKECLETNEWPGYGPLKVISLPDWHKKKVVAHQN